MSGPKCQEHVQGETQKASPSTGPGVHSCRGIRTPRERGSVTDPTGLKGPGIRVVSKIILRRLGWMGGDPVIDVEALKGTVGCFLYHFRERPCRWKETPLPSRVMNCGAPTGTFVFQ